MNAIYAPFRLQYADGRLVGRKLGRLVANIEAAWRCWAGTEAEYISWAEKAFRRGVQSISEHTVCSQHHPLP